MARRRRLFKFNLKRESLVSIAAVTSLLLASLTLISFFAQGGSVLFLQDLLSRLFGWGSFLVPFILASLGLILLGRSFSFVKANLLVGLIFLLFSFSGLSHLIFFRGANSLDLALLGQGGGLLGFRVSRFLVGAFTFLGAFFILTSALVVSWLVLFNVSLEKIVSRVGKVLAQLAPLSRIFGSALRGKPGAAKVTTSDIPKDASDILGNGQTLSVEETEASLRAQLRVEVLPRQSAPEELTQKDRGERSKGSDGHKPTDLSLVQETVKNPPLTNYVWEYPPLSLLSDVIGAEANRGDVSSNAAIIEKTLDSFGIKARVVEVNLGPAVTQYALESAQGTKIARIKNLQNDLAMALASPTGTIRIEAPIPGKSLIGIEAPNLSPAMVNLRTILLSETVTKSKTRLLVALGLDVSGRPVIADIARMPHVLVAGSTGSGKSTLIHAMLASLLFRNSPEELKLILVDTKRVELTEYNDIPHLLTPVITEGEKVLSALKWSIAEMERRYRLFQNARARNIDSYNELSGFQALPYVVILVDEMADMMQMAPIEVEKTVCRLAQMARATGIHLVLSTQRPSVDILTGLIKANIPARIAFNVTSQIDSRVIIDQTGAEKLLGRGDMLYLPPESSKPVRVQGVYVSANELATLIDFLKNSKIKPDYQDEVTSFRPRRAPDDFSLGSDDELFSQAVRVVCDYDRASASLLQRRLKIGYARAARLLDEMESQGIVGPAEGSKPRDVLIHDPTDVGTPTGGEFEAGIEDAPATDLS